MTRFIEASYCFFLVSPRALTFRAGSAPRTIFDRPRTTPFLFFSALQGVFFAPVPPSAPDQAQNGASSRFPPDCCSITTRSFLKFWSTNPTSTSGDSSQGLGFANKAPSNLLHAAHFPLTNPPSLGLSRSKREVLPYCRPKGEGKARPHRRLLPSPNFKPQSLLFPAS